MELPNLSEPLLFAAHGDPAGWLLAVTSVHPLRYDYAPRVLRSSPASRRRWSRSSSRGVPSKVTYKGEVFLLRAFRSGKAQSKQRSPPFAHPFSSHRCVVSEEAPERKVEELAPQECGI